MYTEDVQLWPDEKLLELVQANDCAAFEQVYNRYWSKLYLSAYNMLRDRQASEDIVQEVLVSLWMKRNSAAIESLNAFLYTSVRYQVFKAIRSSKVKRDFFSEAEKCSIANEGEVALSENDINRLLDQGIAELPEKCRQVFLLSRKQDLSTREIAVQLGIAPKTVENQLTTALRRLRATLGNSLFWSGMLLTSRWF